MPDVVEAAHEDPFGLDAVVLTNAEAAAAQSRMAATVSSEHSALSAIARRATEPRHSAAITSLAMGTFPTNAPGEVLLLATNGTTAPANTDGHIVLLRGQTLPADLTLAQLWPGVAGANHVWACTQAVITLQVSHAA